MPKVKRTVTLLKDWDGFLEAPVPRADRVKQGKSVRDECAREAHGKWTRSKRKDDPLDLLVSQDKGRLENLVPYRYGRMVSSPFAFYRGAAMVMARDLGQMERTPITVQLGKRRIKDDPPLIYHSDLATEEAIKITLKKYAESLCPSRQRLLQRYHLVDIAAKAVGVGSVGNAAAILLERPN